MESNGSLVSNIYHFLLSSDYLELTAGPGLLPTFLWRNIEEIVRVSGLDIIDIFTNDSAG